MSDAERRAAADQADRKAASALVASQQHQIQALLARVAELEQLAGDILVVFAAAGDGHRARIGQARYGRWCATVDGTP